MQSLIKVTDILSCGLNNDHLLQDAEIIKFLKMWIFKLKRFDIVVAAVIFNLVGVFVQTPNYLSFNTVNLLTYYWSGDQYYNVTWCL